MTELAGLFLRIHLLVALASIIVIALRWSFARTTPLPARALSVGGRVLLLTAPILALAVWPLPSGTVYTPPAQVWSGASRGAPLAPVLAQDATPIADLHVLNTAATAIAGTLVLCALLGVAWWAASTLWYLLMIQRCRPLKQLGRVAVVARAGVAPFAFSTGLRRVIVVPDDLPPSELQLTVRHELQHHRHATRPQPTSSLWCGRCAGRTPSCTWPSTV